MDQWKAGTVINRETDYII